MENRDSVSPDIRDRREGTLEKKYVQEVRTEAPSPPATGPTAVKPLDSHSKPSFPSQQPERPPQTRMYAGLYRSMQQPDWPDLTDENLDSFTGMSTAQRKSVIDGLLTREKATGKQPELPSKPLESIAAKVMATITKQYTRQRQDQQDTCTHDWLDEGYCGQCGCEKNQPTA